LRIQFQTWKKVFIFCLSVVAILPVFFIESRIQAHGATGFAAQTASAGPEYAKWGQLAMKEAQKRQYTVIDYKYMGENEVSTTLTEYRFKLWVRKNDRPEHGLYVTIVADSQTDRAVEIRIREAER